MQHKTTIVRGQFFFNLAIEEPFMRKMGQTKQPRSKPFGLRQVYVKLIAPMLVAAGYLSACLTEVLLYETLVELST